MRISDWSSDVCSSDLAILTELVEAEGAKAARAGFDSFGPSSLDFALLVHVPGRDCSIAHPIRDRLLVPIIKRFATQRIAIPYPTQTAFTAAPDGTMSLLYPQVQPVKTSEAHTAEPQSLMRTSYTVF